MKTLRRILLVFLGLALSAGMVAQTATHPRVALLFDDGPVPGQTEGILALLAREQVRATFSYVGQNVAAHPELARAVTAAGHEINNHTYTHPHFLTLDDAAIRGEVIDTQAAILAATGHAPRWFWGAYSDWSDRIAAAVVSTGIALYPTYRFRQVSSEDWRPETTADAILRNATTNITDRTIIGCHEWRVETLAMLPAIITELKRQGCVFVTYSELEALTVAPESITRQSTAAGHTMAITAPGASGTLQWRVSTDYGRTWANLPEGSVYHGVSTNTLTITGVTAAQDSALYLLTSTSNGTTTYPSLTKVSVLVDTVPYPTAIAADSSGNLYVTDAATDSVKRIDLAAIVSVFAGTSGQSGSADGTGAAARFNDPSGVFATTGGSLAISDTANATVRLITSAGAVTTLAGSTTQRGNADGPGATATFSSPRGIAQDTAGNLYVADALNHTIRKVAANGTVSTFAGGAGSSGSNDGIGTAARFNHPTGLEVDPSGNVYVADTTNNLIRKITPDGTVTTVAGLVGVSGMQDGTGANALFNQPGGLALDAAGNLYVADTGNSTIRRITPAGLVGTLAGLPGVAGLKDGSGFDAWFNQPRDLCRGADGALYVADTGNAAIRRIAPNGGMVTTLALSAPASSAPPPPPPPTPPTTTPTTTIPPTTTSGSSSGGGGGGALGVEFLALLGIAWFARNVSANCRRDATAGAKVRRS